MVCGQGHSDWGTGKRASSPNQVDQLYTPTKKMPIELGKLDSKSPERPTFSCFHYSNHQKNSIFFSLAPVGKFVYPPLPIRLAPVYDFSKLI